MPKEILPNEKSRLSEVARMAVVLLRKYSRMNKTQLYSSLKEEYNKIYGEQLTDIQVNDSILQLKKQMVIAYLSHKSYGILDRGAAANIASEKVIFRWKPMHQLKEYLQGRVRCEQLSMTDVAQHLRNYSHDQLNNKPKRRASKSKNPRESSDINKLFVCCKYTMEFLGRTGFNTRFHQASEIEKYVNSKLKENHPDEKFVKSTPYNAQRKLLSYGFIWRKKKGNRIFYKYNHSNVKNFNSVFKNTMLISKKNNSNEWEKITMIDTNTLTDISNIDSNTIYKRVIIFQEVTRIILQIFLTEKDDAEVSSQYIRETVESIWKDKFPDLSIPSLSNINMAYTQLVIHEIITIVGEEPRVFRLINRDYAEKVLNREIKYSIITDKKLKDITYDMPKKVVSFPDKNESINTGSSKNTPDKVLDDMDITPDVVGNAILSIIEKLHKKIDVLENSNKRLASEIKSSESDVAKAAHEMTMAISERTLKWQKMESELNKVIEDNKKSSIERIKIIMQKLETAELHNVKLMQENAKLRQDLKESNIKVNNVTKFKSFKDLRHNQI